MSYLYAPGVSRGDPFLGAILGSIGRKAAAWVGGRLGGSTLKNQIQGYSGPSGGGLVGTAAGGILTTTLGNPIPGIQIPGTNTTINPGAILPGGRPFTQPTTSVATNGMCPKGYHLNKSDGKYGPAGTYCVRNRSMNTTNPRALRRALRRAEGFEKLARKTVNALRSGPKKFKSKRKAR